MPCCSSIIGWVVIRQQRPKLLVLFLVSFCGFAFGFSSQELRAEEAGVPSATPAVQSAVASPTPMGPRPYVSSVGIHTWKEIRGQPSVYAQRGDEIWVDIYNLEGWRRELENEKKLPDQNGIKDLVLYLNHRPLAGVAPVYSYETPAWTARSKDEPPVEYKITTVYFPLVRNDASKPTWLHLLNQPVFDRRGRRVRRIQQRRGNTFGIKAGCTRRAKTRSAVFPDDHSKVSDCYRFYHYSHRADRFFRAGPIHAYHSR